MDEPVFIHALLVGMEHEGRFPGESLFCRDKTCTIIAFALAGTWWIALGTYWVITVLRKTNNPISVRGSTGRSGIPASVPPFCRSRGRWLLWERFSAGLWWDGGMEGRGLPGADRFWHPFDSRRFTVTAFLEKGSGPEEIFFPKAGVVKRCRDSEPRVPFLFCLWFVSRMEAVRTFVEFSAMEMEGFCPFLSNPISNFDGWDGKCDVPLWFSWRDGFRESHWRRRCPEIGESGRECLFFWPRPVGWNITTSGDCFPFPCF